MGEGRNLVVSVLIPTVRKKQVRDLTLSSLSQTLIPNGVDLNPVLVYDAPTATVGWNQAYEKAPPSDIYVLGADDIEFVDPMWLANTISLMYGDPLAGYGVVTYDDGGGYGAHFAVSRKFIKYELDGWFLPPLYDAQYVENEVYKRADRAGCLIHSSTVVKHHHPDIGTGSNDGTYNIGRMRAELDEDRFVERFELGFPNTWDRRPCASIDPPTGLAIGIRLARPRSGFVESVLKAERPPGTRIITNTVGHSHISGNEIIKKFLKYTNCSHILFIDDDMTFDYNAIVDITKTDGVVMAFATHKSMPPHAIVLEKLESNEGLPPHVAESMYGALKHVPENELIEVDAVGLGFTVISRGVLEDLIDEYGIEYTDWLEWGKNRVGEDVRLSQKVRGLGYSLHVDTGVKVGHIGEFPIGWNEHRRYVRGDKS